MNHAMDSSLIEHLSILKGTSQAEAYFMSADAIVTRADLGLVYVDKAAASLDYDLSIMSQTVAQPSASEESEHGAVKNAPSSANVSGSSGAPKAKPETATEL